MDIFHEASKSDLAHCFVPEMLTNYIRKSVKRGNDKIEPTSFFIKGVCLLVDISGFTMMSEQFCVQGKSGIDGLQRTTNGYMGKLVDVIYQFGGDIIKFAGDAVVCVFASENFEEENEIPVDVILRAVHCARVIREVRTETLTVHVAMSCGEMCFGILGGYENSWECLISGPCIHQLSDGLDDAPSMQAVLSPECAAILTQNVKGATVTVPASADMDLLCEQSSITTTSGVYEYQLATLPSGNCRIIDITLTPHTPVSSKAESSPTVKKSLVSSRQIATIDSLIRLFVPAPIGEELDNATGLNYFAEIREVATVFMKWDSYDANNKHRDLLDLQACFYQAQRILHNTGGYLRQFLVDDKGCVLIACWGMPNMSYVDNCYRAMSASAQIQHELAKLGMSTSVGITVGDVYCGTVGSYKRMEYAAIACCVNMAARLMGKAKGRLLIGQSAYMRLPKTAHSLLEAIEPMMVKGKATPLQAYKYIATVTSAKVTKCPTTEAGEELSVACRTALTTLLTHMGATHSSRASASGAGATATCDPTTGTCIDCNVTVTTNRTTPTSKSTTPTSAAVKKTSWFGFTAFNTTPAGDQMAVLLISGNEGSGRTSAVSWLKTQSTQRGIPTHSLRISRKDSAGDYSLFRKLFPFFMPKDLFLNAELQRTYVLSLLHRVYPHSVHVIEHSAFPATQEALGITCSYHDAASYESGGSPNRKNMSKGNWSKSININMIEAHIPVHDVLLSVFEYILNTAPTLVVLENIENTDAESLALLTELIKMRTHSSLVLTTLKINTTAQKKRVGGFLLPKKYTIDAAHSTPWSKTYHGLVLQHKGTTSVVLENYTFEEINSLLSSALGNVDSEMALLVQEFSGGSCFWVREIIQCIKDNGTEQFMSALGDGTSNGVGIGSTSNDESHHGESAKSHTLVSASAGLDHQGSIRLKPGRTPTSRSSRNNKNTTNKPTLFTTVPFHEADSNLSQVKLDKLVLCRLNNLATDIQRVLRSASIIGMTFSAKVLFAVLPKHLKDSMTASLDALLRQKWLYQDVECDSNYRFAHSHAHRVIYQLTPLSERNMLHMAVADHIVESYGDDSSQHAAVCYHYQHCCSDKALQYAVKAVAVLLQTDDIFEYGDCLELLFGTFPCVQTAYDVDVMMKLVQQVAVGIHQCNAVKPAYGFGVSAFFSSLYSLVLSSVSGSTSASTTPNALTGSYKVVPVDDKASSNKASVSVHTTTTANSGTNTTGKASSGDKVDLFNPSNTPFTPSETDKLYTIPIYNTNTTFSTSASRYETDTDDGESDLDPALDAVDIETRTKRGFLSQLERLNDQLCSKQAQLKLLDERNGASGGDGVCVVLPEWEKSYLGL